MINGLIGSDKITYERFSRKGQGDCTTGNKSLDSIDGKENE
jgi:hypothetical protein